VSFSCRICQCFGLCHMLFFSTNNIAHVQALYRMRSLCRSYECRNIVRVNIGFVTGFKKIKQRRISFVLGYLRMILWKIATAISIKHRILATFNKKKSICVVSRHVERMIYMNYRSHNFYFQSWMGVNYFVNSRADHYKLTKRAIYDWSMVKLNQ
jgi:hypothetical protein